MSDMTADTPAHRKKTAGKSEGTVAAWAVLIGMGGTTVTYNIFHAIHHGPMPKSLTLGLALLYGIAPVFAAMCLSHLVAARKGDVLMQRLAFAVMLGAMGLSIGAVGQVVKPVAGPYLCWLFGAVLDAAALIALRMILGGYRRKADEVTALEAAEKDVAEARTEADTARRAVADAAGKATALEAELAVAKAALAVVAARGNGKRNRGGTAASKRTGSTARPPRPAGATVTAPVTGSPAAPLSPEAGGMDLDTEALVLWYIGQGHSASKAGELAGVTPRRGRQIAQEKVKKEPPGDQRSDGDMATGEQPAITEHTEG